MSLMTTEDRDALGQAARRFLGVQASSAKVRAAMATERGWDPEAWRPISSKIAPSSSEPAPAPP